MFLPEKEGVKLPLFPPNGGTLSRNPGIGFRYYTGDLKSMEATQRAPRYVRGCEEGAAPLWEGV